MQTELNFTAEYFNTTNLEGAELIGKKEASQAQQKAVKDLFIRHPDDDFIRDEIVLLLGAKCATSIGRCLTNLMNENTLEKTRVRRVGSIYGASQSVYKLIK